METKNPLKILMTLCLLSLAACSVIVTEPDAYVSPDAVLCGGNVEAFMPSDDVACVRFEFPEGGTVWLEEAPEACSLDAQASRRDLPPGQAQEFASSPVVADHWFIEFYTTSGALVTYFTTAERPEGCQ